MFFSRIAIKYFDYLFYSSKGLVFVILFNFRALITGSDARATSINNSANYLVRSIIESDKRIIKFSNESVGANLYSRGIKERGEGIGKAYCLQRINFNHGDCIIDCGANNGDLLLWFQNRNLDIEYIGFEPSANEYACLKQNIFPHKAIRSALWNEEGEKEFFVSPDNGDSSIFKPMKFNEIYKVKTERLEKYVNKEIKLLKVEGEGAEPEIIEGIGSNLEYIHFISADLGGERGLLSEFTVVQVTNFLTSNNFELLDFSPDRFIFLFRNKKYMPRKAGRTY